MKKWLNTLVLFGAMASAFAFACDPPPPSANSCGSCQGTKTRTVITKFLTGANCTLVVTNSYGSCGSCAI